MKILHVRFQNLNSLVGEWEIDLMHPAFASDGIFAITGPTGAGKTTVLDAICLALYGRTPRLNKVNQNDNEIMSRQQGECFAEVTFETRAGRFRCHWSQRRARKRPDGKLQPQSREIANADSGEILASTVEKTDERIEEVTGMDFDRFTRSMLLAQGGFDTFLKAEADKRAPILEQITGTEIYSQISTRVHERRREENEKLKRLEAEVTGIVLMEPEREAELQRDLEAKKKEEVELAEKSAKTAQAVAWRTGIDKLERELVDLSEETAALQNALDAFKPERDELDAAERAAKLDGRHATLSAIRSAQEDDRKNLKIQEEALPGLESAVKDRAEALEAAERQTVKAKEDLKAAASLIWKVRALDFKLGEKKKAVAEGEAACKKDAAEIESNRQSKLGELTKRNKACEILERVFGYLKGHAPDEWLLSGLAGVEEQMGDLAFRQKEGEEKETARKKAEAALKRTGKTLDDCRARCVTRKSEVERAAESLRQGQDTLGRLLGDRLLREYRAEKDALLREKSFLTRIAELEGYRAELQDGKPCPLCGAEEHPFAVGNVPVPDETEKRISALDKLIDEAEAREADIKKLEEAEAEARKNLADEEKRETAAAHDHKNAEETLERLKEEAERIRADLANRRQSLSEKLRPLGLADEKISDLPALLASLKDRLKAWQEKLGEKTAAEKLLGAIDGDLRRLDAIIETQSSILAERRERMELLRKERDVGLDERKNLYGDKSPDDEERRLNEAVAAAEGVEKKAHDEHEALRARLNAAKTLVESLTSRMNQRDPELRRAEAEFAAALGPSGFSDEAAFLKARRSIERLEALSARAKELDDAEKGLAARRADRETRLAEELARQTTDQLLKELEAQFQEDEESLRRVRDVLVGLRHKLDENTAAKERSEAKLKVVEAQRAELRRWQALHDLIGSEDGKKYRNFAQGLTFEMMIGHANRQLSKMTDRYLLVRDYGQPLELNVIDNYQAGEVRSTKNLSGGEGFIVSLALALGLSHMASRNVRVDSLFLDEGFGTLDEEALDVALETLAGLQGDGKLIGVISHVPALKERIGTQIEVTPISGGRSALVGPGCVRLKGVE